MFLGRSEVTVHGPSLNRLSASRRRRRTASCVHASLRRMALWMGSASLSEISVIGISAPARMHEAPKIRSAAILTIAIVAKAEARQSGSAHGPRPAQGAEDTPAPATENGEKTGARRGNTPDIL